MNETADRVAGRENTPFPGLAYDTERFIPNEPAKIGSYGHFEQQRTGQEGTATLGEFAKAFNGDEETYHAISSDERYAVGTAVAGYFLRTKMLIRGSIVQKPFYTIRRTPTMFTPGQATSRRGEPLRYNPNAQENYSYVGGVWLPVDHQGDKGTERAYVSLLHLTRDHRSVETKTSQSGSLLVFGEQNIT